MTVGELLDRISSYEITEWKALYKIRHKEEKEAEKKSKKGGKR